MQPGGFRTQMILNSQLKPASAVQPDYVSYHLLCAKVLASVHGRQPGDPQKAVEIILDIIRGEGCAAGKRWPDVLVLGEDAENDIRARCHQVLARLDDTEWRDVRREVFTP